MSSRKSLTFIAAGVAAVVLFALMLVCGPVRIPLRQVGDILLGLGAEKSTWETIVLESRLPMAVTAILAGSALSVAGLILQTTFRNPLAGPSILGISSGASLGVAIVMLSFASVPMLSDLARTAGALVGALAGSAVTLLALIAFSSVLKGSLSLLIVGIMVSYLASSLISLLNFFAPPDDVRSFVVWGMGSFSSVTSQELPLLAGVSLILLLAAWGYAKPLNAMLLGDRYLSTMGYSVRGLRSAMLIISGLLTAVITAYCGPIGFLGLIVPHIARLLLSTSNHFQLIPACILLGAAVSLGCTLLSILPSDFGVIPINAITPIAGVPIIVYILLNSKKLKYFN